MTPHDKVPWTERRDQEAAVLEVIRQAIDAHDRGQASYRKAVSMIEEALNGDAARIVRVGKQHIPEIET
jgi:hypothetical protein